MVTSDHLARPEPALPEELRGLTYDDATPEQVVQAREYVRAQIISADARMTRFPGLRHGHPAACLMSLAIALSVRSSRRPSL